MLNVANWRQLVYNIYSVHMKRAEFFSQLKKIVEADQNAHAFVSRFEAFVSELVANSSITKQLESEILYTQIQNLKSDFENYPNNEVVLLIDSFLSSVELS